MTVVGVNRTSRKVRVTANKTLTILYSSDKPILIQID